MTSEPNGPVGSVASAGSAGRPVPGWDRIAVPALVHTAQAAAAEALHVPVREVRARVADDGRGALAIEVRGPLALPQLGSHRVPDEPVLARTHRARGVIAERVHTVTGRHVSRVSVVFTSSIVEVPGRVR
ncbi:hypothetical protein [Curtobacterium sp. MCBD17_028]|uniref:hypothetical protein n=1 Tax=Curtobacterium sp. MCBD17_028 TaxID=2175670 RepID=UPI000DA8454D|nr:hypothetical protein [Curtobacterium sp. MCBD17_028]PZE27934.1 hypothetical protein DEI86_04895 [Curtobacterium sp. MCBD17_028]